MNESKVSRISIYNYILFVIWPFLSLVFALKNYKSTYGKNILWLYCIFIGFTFAFMEGSYADSARTVGELSELNAMSLDLNQFADYITYSERTNLDYLQVTLLLIVSIFTDNPNILFAVFGFVFGFFYSRNIWFILEKYEERDRLFSFFIFASFAVAIGPWDINGFRFFTGSMVFLYGVMPFLYKGNWQYLFIAALSILIHWSFIVPMIAVVAYFFIGNRTLPIFVIFILSYFVSFFSFEQITQYFEMYAPEAIQESRGGYVSESYIERRGRQRVIRNWYVRAHIAWMILFTHVFLAYIYLKKNEYLKKNTGLLSLYNFTLIMFILTNTFKSIPSVSRFFSISIILAMALAFLLNQSEKNMFPYWLKAYGVIIMAIFIIVRIRMGFDFIGTSAVFGNPIIASFVENERALIELIKGVF